MLLREGEVDPRSGGGAPLVPRFARGGSGGGAGDGRHAPGQEVGQAQEDGQATESREGGGSGEDGFPAGHLAVGASTGTKGGVHGSS